MFAEAIGCVVCWGAGCLCLLKLLAVSRAGGAGCWCLLKLLAVSRAGGRVFVFAEAIGCVACWGLCVCVC